MKKLLFLTGLLLASLNVLADEADEWVGQYTGRLYIDMVNATTDSVQGSFSPTTTTVPVTRNADGTLNFSIQDLILRDATSGDEMYVGSVNLKNVAAANPLKVEQRVRLIPGSIKGKSWLAAPINAMCGGSVPVALEATLENTNLTMDINIDISRVFGYNVKCRFVALCYQMPNSDFEATWTKHDYSSSKSEMTPASWHSFFEAEGALKTFNTVSGVLTQVTGYDGTGYAAGVVSSSVFGITANGNMTNGCVNMGAMVAADKANHDFSKISDPTKSTLFAGLPDSVSVMVNFKQAANSTGNASFTATLHGAYNYTEPVVDADSAAAYQVARAVASIAKTAAWTRVSVPLTYVDGAVAAHPERYMLMTFAANETPGGGKAGDELDVDHIRFIYNSRLASLTMGGEALAGFSPDSLSYSLATPYDSAALQAVADGVGATVERSYNDTTKVLTITVRGNDYVRNAANQHIYTIAFEQQTLDPMDHNADGQVNLPDAVMIINRVVAGDNSDVTRYDHNLDGQVNLPDAVMIINRIAAGK